MERIHSLRQHGQFQEMLGKLEQLVQENQQHSEALLLLADVHERRHLYGNIVQTRTVQTRRFADAAAALHLWQASNCDQLTATRASHSLEHGHEDCAQFAGPTVEDSLSDDDLEVDHNLDKLARLQDVLEYEHRQDTEFSRRCREAELGDALKKQKQAMLSTGNSVEKRHRFAEVGVSFEKAINRCRTEDHRAHCYFQLANMYIRGQGVDISTNEGRAAAYMQAEEYLEKAVQLNCARSQNLLGRLLMGVNGEAARSSEDFEKGLTLLNFAAAQGHSMAQYALAVIYDEGVFVKVCPAEMRKETLQLAKQLYNDASTNEKMGTKLKNHCAQRAALLAKLLDRADIMEVCAAPWYQLSESVFRTQVQAQLQVPALQRCVHADVRQHAVTRNLFFHADPSKNKSRDIATLMLKQQLRDDVFATVPADVNDSGKKSSGDMERRLQLVQVKQFLKHFDPNPSRESWTDTDVKAIFARLNEYVLLAEKLSGPYEAQDPLTCVEPLLQQMCGQHGVPVCEGAKVIVRGASPSEANGVYTAFQASKKTCEESGSALKFEKDGDATHRINWYPNAAGGLWQIEKMPGRIKLFSCEGDESCLPFHGWQVQMVDSDSRAPSLHILAAGDSIRVTCPFESMCGQWIEVGAEGIVGAVSTGGMLLVSFSMLAVPQWVSHRYYGHFTWQAVTGRAGGFAEVVEDVLSDNIEKQFVIKWSLEGLLQEWNWREERQRIDANAKLVWEQQKPADRQLRSMYRLYRMCEQLRAFDCNLFSGEDWFAAALEHAPVVLHLMQQSEQVEPNPLHHFLSARELITRAKGEGKHWQKVQKEIDDQVGAHLRAKVPRPGLFACIGYHRMKGMTTWDTTVDETVRKSMGEALKHRQELQQSLAQPCGAGSVTLDSDWCRGLHAPRLSEMLTQAVSFIATEQSAQDRAMVAATTADLPCPKLSLARCTFEDPWFYLFTIDGEFQEHERRAKANYETLPEILKSQHTIEDMVEAVLMDELTAKKQRMCELSPPHTDIIMRLPRISRDADHLSRIAMTKKSLFFMRKGCTDWNDDEQVRTLTMSLVCGTEGRCPDGQNSFYDEWASQYILHSAGADSGHDVDMEGGPADGSLRAVQINIATLMQDVRQTFIKKHGSRYSGQHGSESRTTSQLLLSQMLRLPLSLPGGFSQVMYPSYAKLHMDDADAVLTLSSVMRRLLRGGELHHSCDRGRCQTRFEALTLQTIGDLIRSHIVAEQESLQNHARAEGSNLHPVPEVRARISEEVLMGRSSQDDAMRVKEIEDFLSKDAVLSSAWARFKATHFTESNRFFTALADLPAHLSSGGGFLRKVISDATIVRLLEVAGYIDFISAESGRNSTATKFYESVPRGWCFPSLSFQCERDGVPIWNASNRNPKRPSNDFYSESARRVRRRS